MAETNPVLEQRVEALEQFSQTRVVEQVGELTERVSALESARTAENPYLASKSDIVRLEAQHTATQEQLAAHSEQFNKDLKAESELFNKDLNAQSKQVDKQFIAQAERFDSKLDALSERFDSKLEALSERFDSKLDALSDQFDSKQVAQTEQLRREWEQRINQLISWMIVTIIAFFGTVLTATAFIVNRLPA